MRYISPSVAQRFQGGVTYFYDTRSEKLPEILEFLVGPESKNIQNTVKGNVYVVLGGDGLFVAVAKQSHVDNASILGVNFGTKGFLLHDRTVFSSQNLVFGEYDYPMLHADIVVDNEHIGGHAFNEVYVTRAGDASAVRLDISHTGKHIPEYVGDGIMLSTPAGSTGWSKSYGGDVLPHEANLNALTPVGKISPLHFRPSVLTDKGRVRIKNITKREAPVDILLDNRRVVSMEKRPFELVIERANRGVTVLIEDGYYPIWRNKPYVELGFEGVNG